MVFAVFLVLLHGSTLVPARINPRLCYAAGLEVGKLGSDKEYGNEIIEKFNKEIEKDRPDFDALKGYIETMMRVSALKTDEMNEAYKEKNRQVSKEILSNVEKFLARENVADAEEELAYYQKYRNRLDVPFDKVVAFQEKIQRISGGGISEKELEDDFTRAEDFIYQNKIGDARNLVPLLNSKVKKLEKKDQSRYAARVQRMMETINAKEDSLLNSVLEVLRAEGKDAAIEHRKKIARKSRISESKFTDVDNQILQYDKRKQLQKQREQVASQEEQYQSELERRRLEKIRAMREKEEQERLARQREEQERLRKEREKARRDSIRAAKEEMERLRREREEARRDSIEVARKEQERLRKEREKARKDSIEAAKEEQERLAKLRKEREEARRDSIEEVREAQERIARERQEKLERLRRKRERARADSLAEARRKMEEQQRLRRIAEIERKRKEAERQRQIERERQERLAAEKAARERIEQERRAKLAAEAREREEREKERQRLEEERRRKEEAERQAMLRAEQEARSRAEKERIQRERREREKELARQREIERKRREQEETERKERQQKERLERERLARIEAEKELAEKRRRKQEQQRRLERERKENEDKTKKSLTIIYELIDQGRVIDAYKKFNNEKDTLQKYLFPEAFNVLQMTVNQSYVDLQKKESEQEKVAKAAQSTPSGSGRTASRRSRKAASEKAPRSPRVAADKKTTPRIAERSSEIKTYNSKEDLYIKQIRSLLDRNKVKDAYRTFKRFDRDIKRVMDRDDFKRLKERVFTAYKYYREAGGR
ncbi:MAG: hypothetical protein GF350_05670 [Chitinivibrionales bacterium]|nr:hypothetical protein [Chitinivibrionales bacterium]